MATSKELNLAVLSLDSYNRGYNSGLADSGASDTDGLGEGGQIGSASIINRLSIGIGETAYNAWQDVGFYAVAYDTPYGKVISHRGTDNWGSLPNVTDIFYGYGYGYGYGLGAGSPYGEQAAMAAEF